MERSCTMMISSSRLLLKPIDLEWGNELIITTTVGENWPSNALKSILPFYLERLEKDEKEFGFGPWVVMDKSSGRIYGNIGFKGKADKNQQVEIGYEIILEYRNKGIATEAVGLLCRWAFEHQIKKIIAITLKDNKPSQQVLLKNEFEKAKQDNEIIYFRKINFQYKSVSFIN